MGTHWYQCPVCKSQQQVKAQAGVVVEVGPCQACEEVLRQQDAEEGAPEAYLARSKRGSKAPF